MCENFVLSNERDKAIWTLENKGFSVKSLYSRIRSDAVKVPYKFL
jgi:hypothetical protein